MTNRKNERGQVLVLTVLLLGALLGFGAIALDGGNIYADRRSAQAAADSASTAGALAVMRGYGHAQVLKVAELRAERNGYANVAGKTTVTVNWPPVAPHPYAGNWNYVQVIITNRLDTILAHMFYRGPFQHTVQATAHASRNETLLPGYTMYADNPSACPGVRFDGSMNAVLTGGGSVLSNSTASCSCALNGASGVSQGNGSVTVVDPTGRSGIFSVGCWEQIGGTFTNIPAPRPGAGQQYVDPPPLPDCSGLPDFTALGDQRFNGGAPTLVPGRYDSIATGASANLTLQPGIYCLEGTLSGGGGDLSLSIGANSGIIGPGVMIYLSDTAGGVQALGNGLTQLVAGDPSGPTKPELVDAAGEDWRGMLIYAHPNNTNSIYLSGGSGSEYTGTIYGPGMDCDMHGNGEAIAFNTQMICDTVLVTGAGDLSINYNPGSLYHRKDRIELFH